PDKAAELARNGGHDMLFAFAACREAGVPPIQPLLRGPRRGDRRRWSPALAGPDRRAHKGMVAIVPGRFDEDAPEMRVAGFGDAALDPSGAAGVLGGDEADIRHYARGGRKAPGIAELGGDREGREVVDASE